MKSCSFAAIWAEGGKQFRRQGGRGDTSVNKKLEYNTYAQKALWCHFLNEESWVHEVCSVWILSIAPLSFTLKSGKHFYIYWLWILSFYVVSFLPLFPWGSLKLAPKLPSLVCLLPYPTGPDFNELFYNIHPFTHPSIKLIIYPSIPAPLSSPLANIWLFYL